MSELLDSPLPVEDTGPPAPGSRLPHVGRHAPRGPGDGVQDDDDGRVVSEEGGRRVGGVVDRHDAAVLHRQPLALVPDRGEVLLPVRLEEEQHEVGPRVGGPKCRDVLRPAQARADADSFFNL